MAHANNIEFSPTKYVGRTLLMGAFLTAFTVGVERVATYGDVRRLKKRSRLISHLRDEGNPIYIMPGCRADGEYIGEMLEPHIQHIGPTHHEAYSETDFDLEDIKQKELNARTKDLGRAAIVYCSSMGGMKFTKSLSDPEYREKFGQIETLIFDSSPSDERDLDNGTRKAMLAAHILPQSWMVSKLYQRFMIRAARNLLPHSPRVTDEQVRGHQLSTANTPLHAVRSQTKFIKQTHLSHLQDGELAGIAKNIYYISSSRDHVVDTDRAYAEYNRIYGGTVIRLIDYQRHETSHAGGPEDPELIIRLMEGSYEPGNPNMQSPEDIPWQQGTALAA